MSSVCPLLEIPLDTEATKLLQTREFAIGWEVLFKDNGGKFWATFYYHHKPRIPAPASDKPKKVFPYLIERKVTLKGLAVSELIFG